MKRQDIARVGCLLATLALAVCCGVPSPAQAWPARAVQRAAQTVHLAWIQVDPLHPEALYAGGYLERDYPCFTTPANNYCPAWSARSMDAGRSWQQMGVAPDILAYPRSFIYPASTGYVYAALATDGSPGGSGNSVWRSRDHGIHWEAVISLPGNIGSHLDSLAISPVAAATVYVITLPSDGVSGYDPQLRVTDDAGTYWRIAPGAPTVSSSDIDLPVGSLLADARHRDTVYLGLTPLSVSASWPSLWTRTEDAGRSWHLVANPPGSQVPSGLPGSTDPVPVGFTLGIDPHLPGLLLARVPAAPAPTRHRYVSADAGRTWRPVACPGALGGACPLTVVDNVLGAGRSYGFYADGVHAFSGAGPAGSRLAALSDRLPVAPGGIVAAQSGTHAGNPVYVLARGGDRLQLYRCADAGRSWRRITRKIAWCRIGGLSPCR